MSEIRIAVIGANQLDLDHRHALNALSDSGRIAVYALESDSLEEGREALQRAVDLNAIDAAIIAGRRKNLAAWIGFALETGWPVYTPYAVPSTIEDMIEIRRAEQQNAPALLQFGLSARLHDSVSAARSKADSGEYGQLLSLRAVCGVAGVEADDSVLFGPAAQLVDIMQLFAGPFQDVTGFADLDRQEDPGSETNVLASLRTHSGVLANLHASATQWRPTLPSFQRLSRSRPKSACSVWCPDDRKTQIEEILSQVVSPVHFQRRSHVFRLCSCARNSILMCIL